MSNEPELTPNEEESVKWLMEWAIPKRSREDAVEIVLIQRTELWNKLRIENFAEAGSDYGYGGEVVDTLETDHDALWKWITEREKSILGMTLEEFAKTDWRIE